MTKEKIEQIAKEFRALFNSYGLTDLDNNSTVLGKRGEYYYQIQINGENEFKFQKQSYSSIHSSCNISSVQEAEDILDKYFSKINQEQLGKVYEETLLLKGYTIAKKSIDSILAYKENYTALITISDMSYPRLDLFKGQYLSSFDCNLFTNPLILILQ